MDHFFNARSMFFVLTTFAVFVLIECDTPIEFQCGSPSGENLPNWPTAFSTDVRLNFATKLKTVDLRHYKDDEGKRESLEIITLDRHVKYIVHGEQHLLITFLDNDFAKCSLKSSSTIVLEDEDSGPNGILQRLFDVTKKNKEFKVIEGGLKNGIYAKKWEGCFKDPKVNVSVSYSEVNWNNPGKGSKDKRLPVTFEAQIDNDFVVGLVDNFHPSMPEDIYFQPPADVYCAGFREDKKPPEIKDFFSYDAEMIMFNSRDEVPSLVSHRSVYYDVPSLITRVDFHDLQIDLEDSGSEVKAKGFSIIHDFNAKIVYSFGLPTFQCEVEDFIITEEVVEQKETKETPMPSAMQYFALDAKKISYNGQFTTRGLVADVYTAVIPHLDGTNGKSIYSWHFSSVQTQIVEKAKVEKNVLLRMVVHPETGTKRRDRIEMNLYNFEKQQPSSQVFDISYCYNETTSKLFVLTFPANSALRGSEMFLKLSVHSSLKEITGLRQQRISVTEIAFSKEFMYAEFKILESPSVLKAKGGKKELSLDEAVAKIQASVSDQSLKVSVSTGEELITLIPLQNGFNEFSGDRKVADPNSYSQGSVIGLTIGMLLLGFVVGGVALNLIVSRKYGVSLFQRKSGGNNFNNPLNESGL